MKKLLIAKLHERNHGIQVGWRVFDTTGASSDIYWGLTRDPETLASMIGDARRRGFEFDLDDSALAFLPGDDGFLALVPF